MSLRSRTHISTLPLTVAERLDVVCDRFEAACEGGQRPLISDYLEGVDEPARAVLARELIVLDLHYRHRRAEVPRVADYDAVNPDPESNWLTRAVADLTNRPTWPVLPGYEILGELGRRGIGIVYRTFDEGRGVPVALKTMRRADAEAIRRFKQEFRTLADVSHPNLVGLHELATDGSIWFFTMELIEGDNFLNFVLGGQAEAPASTVERRCLEPRREPPCHAIDQSDPTDRSDWCRRRNVQRQRPRAARSGCLRPPWTGCESPSSNWPRGWHSSTRRASSTAT